MKALCLIFPDGYGAFFFICQRHTQSQRLFVHLLHHTQMQHPMKVKIEESWRQRLQEEFDKPYFERKQAPHTATVHPSPRSAEYGFFGCKHFSKANNYLRSKGIEEIDW